MWKLLKLFFWIFKSKQLRKAAEFAVNKSASDKQIDKNSIKREEAVEWAGHFLREEKSQAKESEIRFMVELVVQLRKRG